MCIEIIEALISISPPTPDVTTTPATTQTITTTVSSTVSHQVTESTTVHHTASVPSVTPTTSIDNDTQPPTLMQGYLIHV